MLILRVVLTTAIFWVRPGALIVVTSGDEDWGQWKPPIVTFRSLRLQGPTSQQTSSLYLRCLVNKQKENNKSCVHKKVLKLRCPNSFFGLVNTISIIDSDWCNAQCWLLHVYIAGSYLDRYTTMACWSAISISPCWWYETCYHCLLLCNGTATLCWWTHSIVQLSPSSSDIHTLFQPIPISLCLLLIPTPWVNPLIKCWIPFRCSILGYPGFAKIWLSEIRVP